MTSSMIASSSSAQWLQGLLAKGASAQTSHPSNSSTNAAPAGMEDTTSISAKAFQLNQAAGVSSSFNKEPVHNGFSDAYRLTTTHPATAPRPSLATLVDSKDGVKAQPLGSRISFIC